MRLLAPQWAQLAGLLEVTGGAGQVVQLDLVLDLATRVQQDLALLMGQGVVGAPLLWPGCEGPAHRRCATPASVG